MFGLPADKLWVTVYAEDDEAYAIWAEEVGVPAERIVRIGDNKGARYASDNFWMMGDTGPCGPCSEIFFDHGPGIPGGPPGSPDEDGDRYIEIWNNVFMQFNRDEAGVMHPLPKPSVDTGMGLERIAAVLQHVHSNYEIDLFANLLVAAAREVRKAGGSPAPDSPSLKVLADHIRACAFTVADGVIPGNEGRGYVLRRIARRAIRHGYKLGARRPFFHRLVAALASEMGDAYPELRRDQERITAVLRAEEERFFETIAHGMTLLEGALAAQGSGKVLDGETAFKLHDTFGFPLDLTADVCRERGVTVDEAAFDRAMNRQREQARAAGKFKTGTALEYSGEATGFHGYEGLTRSARVVALYRDGAAVPRLAAGERGVVVLDHTPFYAESGGQVGDRGQLTTHGQGADAALFEVDDTLKIQADVFGHHGVLGRGALQKGDEVEASVDIASRHRIMRNHSVTHLMHKALREVLGPHVQQKGSLVDAERTRFDFSHNAPVTPQQIQEIESKVNAEILLNTPTQARVMPFDEAVKSGAVALFGEKYGGFGPGAGHRHLARAVRWHPCSPNRRHRPLQGLLGRRRGGRHPPDRGGHRRRRSGACAAASADAQPRGGDGRVRRWRNYRSGSASCRSSRVDWSANSDRSRRSSLPARATTWPSGPSRSGACACSRPGSTDSTRKPCAPQWTS